MPGELVTPADASSPYPELCKNVVDFSRRQLGFFSGNVSRVHEFSWAILRAGDVTNLRLVEIGAGVNPLPLWFAAGGAAVVTVDNHPLVFTAASRPHWREWGFLDYSGLDPRVTSRHADFCDVDLPAGSFDIAYSISVIEHVSAGQRRQMLRKTFQVVRGGGRLLFTVDLVPGTKALWNRSSGNVVEDPAVHGDLNELLEEISAAGFTIAECETRMIAGSRTDVAFIAATRTSEA